MKDQDVTKAQLIVELKEMRRLVDQLKKSEAMLKKAQESLKDEVTRRRIMLERSRDGIVVLDQNGKVYEATQRFADMLGYPMEELLQLHVWEWETTIPKEQLQELARDVEDTGGYFETCNRRKDGTLFDAEVGVGPIMYRGHKLSFCICRDITERKQAEEALKDEATRRRILVEQSKDGIVVLDQNGKVYEANQRFADMHGYSMDEVLQLHAWDWEATVPREQIQEAVRDIENTGGYFETRNRRKDGTLLDAEISINALMYRGQKFSFCICRDITERKQAEKALKKAHDELEKRVQERTAELAKAIKELKLEVEERKRAQKAAEAASIAKSNFLSTMSHELRTPLNHIIGFTELLLDKKFGDLNEHQAEYLNDVLQSGNHLLALVNDILDLSRVEGSNEELNLQDINLKALFKNSLTIIKEKAQRHRIKLLTNIDKAPETIKGDEQKLKKIVYNLLSNAVKFTPDGGEVTLYAQTVEVEDKERSSGMSGPESAVEISITDTGIGIKKEDISRIFNPFEQADGSARRRYEGTGLGLSLAKSLVELHGGKIWAESEGKDKGSTFRFIIPR